MMIFLKFTRSLIIVSLALSLFSCEKQYQNTVGQNNLLEANYIDIMEVLSRSAETVVQLKHDVNDFGQGSNSESKVFARIGTTEEGLFSYPSTVVMNDKVDFSIENSFNVFTPNEAYRDLFGTSLFISYEPSIQKDGDSNLPIIEVGHVPDALDISLSGPNNKFSPGDEIRWNVDNDNTGGVFVVIKYATALNEDEMVAANPVSCTEYVRIDDHAGKYVLDESNFNCIPDGAIVTIRIIRGAGVEVKDENGEAEAIVAAYSVVSGITRYNP